MKTYCKCCKQSYSKNYYKTHEKTEKHKKNQNNFVYLYDNKKKYSNKLFYEIVYNGYDFIKKIHNTNQSLSMKYMKIDCLLCKKTYSYNSWKYHEKTRMHNDNKHQKILEIVGIGEIYKKSTNLSTDILDHIFSFYTPEQILIDCITKNILISKVKKEIIPLIRNTQKYLYESIQLKIKYDPDYIVTLLKEFFEPYNFNLKIIKKKKNYNFYYFYYSYLEFYIFKSTKTIEIKIQTF